MKTIALGFAAIAAVASFGLNGLAEAQPSERPVVIEGKDRPILLARMVVTATPLDDDGL